MLPTFKGSIDKLVLNADGVATTPLSGQPDVYRGISPAAEKLLQGSVDQIYRRFTGLVATARHMPQAKVDDLAQGRVWAGGTARQIGLVDQFGSLDDAIAYAASKAGLSDADARPRWIEREPNGFKEMLRGLVRPSGGSDSAVIDPIGRLARQPEALALRAAGDTLRLLDGPAMQVRCLECGGAEPASAGKEARALAALKMAAVVR